MLIWLENNKITAYNKIISKENAKKYISDSCIWTEKSLPTAETKNGFNLIYKYENGEITAEYEKEIPEFAYRLKVKAGLTGYAQVYGKYNTTAYDKLKLDLMYIQNYNIRLDFEIMFKTVQILFIRESTEGMEAGQFIALTKEQEGIYEREK